MTRNAIRANLQYPLSGGVACEVDRHVVLFAQCLVIRAQDIEHLRAAELLGHLIALRQQLAQLGARQQEPILGSVTAGAHRCHAVTAITPERPVDLYRPGLERIVRDLVEYVMGVERAVVVAYAGVVTADEQM